MLGSGLDDVDDSVQLVTPMSSMKLQNKSLEQDDLSDAEDEGDKEKERETYFLSRFNDIIERVRHDSGGPNVYIDVDLSNMVRTCRPKLFVADINNLMPQFRSRISAHWSAYHWPKLLKNISNLLAKLALYTILT